MAKQQDNTQNNQGEQDIGQLLKIRRQKLADLQSAGKDPFLITRFDVSHSTSEASEEYERLETKLLDGREPVDVSGLPEEEARPLRKKDYEERRAIMDAEPINVIIAGFFRWQDRKSRRTSYEQTNHG